MENTIFRKEAIDDVSDANQFQDYIKTSNVSLFVILAASILAIAALCIWGAFGQIPICISQTAFCRDGKLICFVDAGESGVVTSDSKVICHGEKYPVDELDKQPLADDDVRQIIGNDYIFTQMNVPAWGIEIVSDAPETMGENETCEVELLVGQATMFELLFR